MALLYEQSMNLISENEHFLRNLWFEIRKHTKGGARQLAYNSVYLETMVDAECNPVVVLRLGEREKALSIFAGVLAEQCGFEIRIQEPAPF